jgi:hypothetical protein
MSRKFQTTSLTKSSSKLIHISRDVLNIVDISLPPKVVRFSVNNENRTVYFVATLATKRRCTLYKIIAKTTATQGNTGKS